MADLIEFLLFRPIIACWQVIMAICLTTKSPRLRRLQWISGILLLIGIVGIASAFVCLWYELRVRILIALLLSGIGLMVIASAIAYYVEKEILYSRGPERD